jgi:hypothetical protein
MCRFTGDTNLNVTYQPASVTSHQPECLPEFVALTQEPNESFPLAGGYYGQHHVDNPSTDVQQTYLCVVGQSNNSDAVEDLNTGYYNGAGCIDNSAAMPIFARQTALLGPQAMSPEVNSHTGPLFTSSSFPGDPIQVYHGVQAPAYNMQTGPVMNNYTSFSDHNEAYRSMQAPANNMQTGNLLNNYTSFSDLNQAYSSMPNAAYNMQTEPLMNRYPPFGSQAYPGMQAPPVPGRSQIPIPCTHNGCFRTFRRDQDRIRHEATVHHINQMLHLCHVPGCSKAREEATPVLTSS